MLSILQAIILGAVQGATEFLPVSSSGHLLLASTSLNIPSNFAAETLLNFGTIAVILIYFWRQIWEVARDLFSKVTKLGVKKEMVAKLAIGVIPSVVIGLLLGDFIEKYLYGTGTVVFMLVAVGIPMIFVKKVKYSGKKLNTNIVQDVSYLQATVIGLVQPIALVSGTSRSGITILAGLLTGLSVETAASFSFLIGLPVILGATLSFLFANDGSNFLANNFDAFVAGNVASFIVGFIAVYFLMDVVKREGLRPFGIYRLILALAVTLFVLI